MINFINITKEYPNTTFALWTKRLDIACKVLKVTGKPKNFILVFSNPFIDEPLTLKELNNNLVDKVFNVITDRTDKRINCGKKKCIECMTCYTHNNITEIYEALK